MKKSQRCKIKASISSSPIPLTDGHNNNDGDLISVRESVCGKKKKKRGDLIANWEAAPERGLPGPSRPIANDGPEANELFKWCLPHFKRLLRTGGCCCCCCCGGGGPDPQFARWSMWINKVLDFKQMIVWDKGPMGMGWHYRRSYETVLVAMKPGGACKWYDDSDKIENIIRPGQYGIKKIIPRGDVFGLDSTCCVKLAWEGKENHPCQKEQAALVTLLKRVTSESMMEEDLRWSIDESGENITAQYPTGSLSIILTKIKQITESRTFNSLMLLPTKDFIQVVEKTAKEGGGNPVESVVYTNLWKMISTNKKTTVGTPYRQNVRRVGLKLLLSVSEEKGWSRKVIEAGQHSCEKPVELAAHFIKLHTKKGDTVLDPFMGRGWVGVACKKLGREFIGIEIDKHWYDLAKQRIEAVNYQETFGY